MTCTYCGGDVDDPFWDTVCPDCQHERWHDQDKRFDPSCSLCIGEAEDHYEQGERWNGKEWAYA